MKVVYSIASKLAGHGTGTTAYEAVKGIYRHNALTKVFCLRTARTEIEPQLVQPVWPAWIIALLARYSKQVRDYGVAADVFDIVTSSLIVRKDMDKFDIFHVFNRHGLRTIKRAKAMGVITVVQLGSLHPRRQERILTEEFEKYGVTTPPLGRRYVEQCLKEIELCDYLFVPTTLVAESLVAEGVQPSRIRIIPFGCNPNRFHPSEKVDNIFRVIFVGQVCLRKGIQYLLECWERLRLPNSELLIVGDVHDDAMPIFKKYQHVPGITMLGHSSEVPKFMAQSSAFVLPAVEDGCPLVVFEAMASGLPVVIFDTVGSKDFVRDGVEGFVVPSRNVEKLAERILYLFEHEASRKEMGKGARKQALEFTWERHGDALVDAYKKILELKIGYQVETNNRQMTPKEH